MPTSTDNCSSSPECLGISTESLQIIATAPLQILDFRWLKRRFSNVPIRDEFFASWAPTLVSLATPSRFDHLLDLRAYRYLIHNSPALKSLHLRLIASTDGDLFVGCRELDLMDALFGSRHHH